LRPDEKTHALWTIENCALNLVEVSRFDAGGEQRIAPQIERLLPLALETRM
jgi:hypothetical protein